MQFVVQYSSESLTNWEWLILVREWIRGWGKRPATHLTFIQLPIMAQNSQGKMKVNKFCQACQCS